MSNTAVQIQMFTALIAAQYAAAQMPRFAHEALLVGKEGKLSKRLGSLGCDAFREQGYEAMAIVSLLGRLGTSQPVEAFADPTPLIDTFDLSTFGRAPAKFDEIELARLNAQIVHQLPFEAVKGFVPEDFTPEAWHAIRPNLEKASEVIEWWQVVTGPIPAPDFSDVDRAYMREAAGQLEWSDTPWQDLTGALKQTTGRKGKELFLPLRRALTGMDHGPDMKELLPLIGEEEARARLERAAA